jgi:hypothetical protein
MKDALHRLNVEACCLQVELDIFKRSLDDLNSKGIYDPQFTAKVNKKLLLFKQLSDLVDRCDRIEQLHRQIADLYAACRGGTECDYSLHLYEMYLTDHLKELKQLYNSKEKK